MPRVSVVIPTYNRISLVQQAIDSVLRQTYQDRELIVVDDGSTDDTLAVLDARYGRAITIVEQPNQGESAARNHGIAIASGEYVAFLDSDDLWHPHKLAKQVPVLDAHPSLGLLSAQARWMNAEGLHLRMAPHGHDRSGRDISWAELLMGNCVAGGGSAAVVRRSCLDAVDGFDESIRFGEEWDLWLRIASRYPIQQLPEPLIDYRINPLGTRTAAPRPEEVDTLFSEHVAIVEKALANNRSADAELVALGGEARSRVRLREAMANLCLGRMERGSTCWARAVESCSAYALGGEQVHQIVVNTVSAYALLDEGRDGGPAVRRMVDRIIAGAPAEAATFEAARSGLLGRIYAELAHRSAMNRDTGMARRYSLAAFRSSPRTLSNLGLGKIALTGGRHLWPVPPGATPAGACAHV